MQPGSPNEKKGRLMEKKKMMGLAAGILLFILLLIPQTRYYKDGGTVEYHAVLYQVFHWHAMLGDPSDEMAYYDGLEVRILGIPVFNNAKEKRI